MTTETEIKCPYCGNSLKIDELIKSRMEREFAETNKKRMEEMLQRQRMEDSEETKRKVEEAIEREKLSMSETVEKLTAQIQLLTERNQKATEEMLAFQKKEFELKQQLRNTELEAQKRFNEQIEELTASIRKTESERNELEIAKLQKKLSDANAATAELQHKLEQGSQQLQGETQELLLENCLREEFPFDDIREVDKGRLGADVIQTVMNRSGKVCGVIVWESKNVKGWNNDFIPKLRNDMEAENGDVGILVSNVFGRNMREFTSQDGVWLIRPANVLAIARPIRDGIIKASNAKAVAEHKETLQDAVFAFVTSQAFRNRVENIGQQYMALEDEIYKTKVYMDRHWDTQRKMIDNLVENTQGIIGDVDAYLLNTDSDGTLMIESNNSDQDTKED